jgi:hypothetical protein
MKWNEKMIGRALSMQVFHNKNLIVIPNCTWPGSECDLLAVRPDLRLVDVEIKISRADLKADQYKDKWLHPWDYRAHGWRGPAPGERARVEWPAKIWKHYYALPRDIWRDDLVEDINPMSGILLMRARDDGTVSIGVERQAKPNKAAQPISPADVINLARLASVRMWDAYLELERRAA